MKARIQRIAPIWALMWVIIFASCAAKTHFQNSTVVPGAEGSVTISKDKNKNYKVKVDVINLAAPDRLEPSKSFYIVWMKTGDQTKNLGQISIASNKMTHALKASFETVTPLKPEKIFITAENDVNIQSPGEQMILTTGKL